MPGVRTSSCSICAATSSASRRRSTTPARATSLEREQRDVLAHAQRQQHALGMAVARQVHDARALHPAGVAQRHALAGQRGRARRAQQSRERAQELALAVALDAREPDDLAGPDIEVDIVEARAREPAHAQQRLAAGRELGLGREGLIDGAPDDQAQDLRLGDARRGDRAARLAVAQDRDAVGDALHLRQPVRDVDDGGAGGGDRAHLVEQQRALDGRERLGRLVQHEHLRLERQRLGDLDELAVGDAQLAHPRRGIDGAGPDHGQLLACPRPCPQERGPLAARHREDHRLGDREVFEDGEVLVDDGQPQRLRAGGRGLLHDVTADLDDALVGQRRAGGDGHQRRLARAVLAYECMNLALDDLEADALERHDPGVRLDDVGEAENDAGCRHLPTTASRTWR